MIFFILFYSKLQNMFVAFMRIENNIYTSNKLFIFKKVDYYISIR